MATKLKGTWQQGENYLEQVQDRVQDPTKA